MAVDIVIKNGQLVLPSGIVRAGIAVNREKIVAIAPEEYLPEANKTIDATGKYVIPGFVDEHQHLHVQELMYKTASTAECFRDESKAAACGGVTTCGHMLTFMRNFPENLESNRQDWDNNAVVDTIFHHQMTCPAQIAELDKCPDLGIVTIGEIGGYKGPAAEEVGVCYLDDGTAFQIMEVVGKWGPPGRVWFHGENADVITFLKQRIVAEGRKDSRAWTAFRPAVLEHEKMKCYIELAKLAKCPIGYVHMTSGGDPAIIAKGKEEGVDVVGETCPQYLILTQDTFKDSPWYANVNPPLRDTEDNEALWQGIRDGWVETVATDHCAMTKKQKGTDIMTAPPGLSDVITTWMPIMLSEGVNKGRITLEKMVEVCCYNPAKYLGILPQKGVLAAGSDADIVIVDLKQKAKAKTNEYSAADFNIYEVLGWEFQGWPILTMVRGHIVMEDGKIVGKEGTGSYIKRKLFNR